MSLAKLTSQAGFELLFGVAVPKALPVLLNLKFTVGASGAPTIVSTVDSTNDGISSIDFTITRVSQAVYDITFNQVRRVYWGTLSCCAKTAAATGTGVVASDARYPVLERSGTFTNGGTGKARIIFATAAGVATELAPNSEMNLSFWVDAG